MNSKAGSWPRSIGIVVIGIVAPASVLPLASAQSAVDIGVQLDRGEDLGQNFGTLFEARTKDGKFVLGAGFLGLYNTYYRSDRHTVHFFIRPAGGARKHTMGELPRPGKLAGAYLFSRDGTLYAADADVHAWNESEGRWNEEAPNQRHRTRVANGMLVFDGSQVEFNGERMLTGPAQGRYSHFYYAQSHLFFYHTYWAEQRGYRAYTADRAGYSKLYACPWRNGEGPIDLAKAVVLTVPTVGEIPFAYGQLRGDVLTCSNIGGLYAFDGNRWRTVLDGDLNTSYQVYSMLNFHDKLLMGQYPTGELFEFNGETVTHLEGWPPRMDGVRGSAREAQSTTIYGGQLYVGVWPWGELWRYHPGTKDWNLAKRMFDHPAPTEKTTHPYENECAALGVVSNQWGQRVTSLVASGPSLMVSTSAKWPCKWEPKFDFVGRDKWKAYGTVSRLTVPGHLSAPLAWTEGTTELRFTVSDAGIAIIQDGNVAARTEATNALSSEIASMTGLTDITWGAGVYGAFGGSKLDGELRPAAHR